MTQEISRLTLDCPHWRIWASDAGWLYATRPGIAAHDPSGSRTVHPPTPARLRQVITDTEDEHARMRAGQQRLFTGQSW